MIGSGNFQYLFFAIKVIPINKKSIILFMNNIFTHGQDLKDAMSLLLKILQTFYGQSGPYFKIGHMMKCSWLCVNGTLIILKTFRTFFYILLVYFHILSRSLLVVLTSDLCNPNRCQPTCQYSYGSSENIIIRMICQSNGETFQFEGS